MDRFRRSWALLGTSLRVLTSHKKLLLFPIVITALTLVIAAFFLIPLATMKTGYAVADVAHWKSVAQNLGLYVNDRGDAVPTGPFYGLMAAVYLLSMFLSTFFNVAFYHEILLALNGQKVSLTRGFRFAGSRIPAIAAWSLFSGLVGLLIKAIEERVGWFGRLVVRLVGIAWSVAAVFAIPVIVKEGSQANPVKFLRSSAALLRKTWGEALIGYVGFSAVTVAAFALLPVLTALSMFLGLRFLVVVLGLWFVSFVFVTYVVNVAEQVYKGALYVYASEGVVPGPFDKEQMNMAWRLKTGRK